MAGQRDLELPDAFDRLLRQEMSIEPSPAFLPRVRDRIDGEPSLGSWQWLPWMTGAGAAAALCLLVAAGTTVNLNVGGPPTAPGAPVLRTGDPIHLPSGVADVSVPVLVRQPFRAAAAAAPAEDVPTVLIDERQRAALSALFRMVRAGRLTEETLAATGRTSLQPIREQLSPVGVKPVETNPIVVGGVQPTEK